MSGNGTPVEPSTEPVPAADRALAESLRVFLRDELKNNGLDHTPKKKSEDLRPLQVVFLIAFALDITFFYFHLIGGEESKFLVFLYKLLPALGVTLAVPYLDRLRSSLLKHSSNPRLGTPFLGLAVVLLVMQASIYSIFVQVDSASTDVEIGLDDGTKVATKKVELDKEGRVFLPVPKLQSYRVVLRDQDGGTNPEASYQITWGDVLKGTLAQLPFFGDVFKPRLLVAAYEVTIVYMNQRGNLYISADPDFTLNQPITGYSSGQPSPNYSNVRLHSVASGVHDGDCTSKVGCWHKQINSGDAFALPRGSYTFTQDEGKCVVWEPVQILRRQQVTLEPGAEGVHAQGCQ